MLFDVGLRTRSIESDGGKHSRREFMAVHGFRKWMDTRLTGATRNPVGTEILLGHDIGLKGSYFKPDAETLLGEYRRGMDALTIDDANRLKRANVKLTAEVNEVQLLRAKMEKQTEEMAHYKKQAAQFDDALMHLWPAIQRLGMDKKDAGQGPSG